ncbi:MAG: succinylglutamate desuccinylase/aspartoacylase family protein [Victivallales bacterium]|nr:succinylglutamate desuccinylase/aspartoacylase family protein [Victivallales bacterium]
MGTRVLEPERREERTTVEPGSAEPARAEQAGTHSAGEAGATRGENVGKGSVRRGHFTLLSATPEETRARFELGEFSVREVEEDGHRWSVLEVPRAARMSQAGAPEVPVYWTGVAVAKGRSAVLRVRVLSEREVVCAPPRPSAGLILRKEETFPEPDATIYGSQASWPSSVSSLGKEYCLRGVEGRSLVVYPMRYDFARGALCVAESVELTVRSEGATAEEYGRLSSEWNLRQLQRGRMLNGELLRGDEKLVPGRLLVVCPDEWASGTEEFLAWKEFVGFDTELAKYPTDTGEGQEALAQYIRSAYEADGLTHVILCGDASDVPPAFTCYNPSYPGSSEPTSDTRYALLDEEAFTMDFFISRVPAHNAEQLGTVLSKLLTSEQAPAKDDGWRLRAIYMASNKSTTSRDSPYYQRRDYEIMGEIADTLATAGVYGSDSARLFAVDDIPDAQLRAALISALNAGAPLMMYLGDGMNTSLSVSDFSIADAIALVNGNRLPFCYLPVCKAGNFAYPKSDCLAEAFFLGSTPASNGATAVIASTSDVYWSPPIWASYCLTDYLLAAETTERLTCYGAYHQSLSLEGAIFSKNVSPHQDSLGLYYVQQMHLFGDCSQSARLRTLRTLEPHCVKVGDTLSVTVTWEDGTPVPGALLSLHQNDVRVDAAATDENGTATLTVIPSSGTGTLLVTDPSGLPVETEIPMEDFHYLVEMEPLPLQLESTSPIYPPEIQSISQCVLTDGTLPDGMELTEDGFLEGIPSRTGTFSFEATGLWDSQWEVFFQVTCQVVLAADTNGDGFVSNQELLAWLEVWNDDWKARDTAIANWVATGTEETREATEKLEVPLRIMPVPVWEAILRNDSAAQTAVRACGADVVAAWTEGLRVWMTEEQRAALLAEGVEILQCEPIAVQEQTRGKLYHTPEELNAAMQELAASHWDICRPRHVGTTTLGRDMLALRISSRPEDAAVPELLVAGGIHGNERTSVEVAWRLARFLVANYASNAEIADLLDNVAVWILPMTNPDGVAAVSRYNANNIDLNRTFPDGVDLRVGAFAAGDTMHLTDTNSNRFQRQPETCALMRWSSSRHFAASLHLHTGDTLVCYPYGNKSSSSSARAPDVACFQALAKAFVNESENISVTQNSAAYYPAVGEFADWSYRYLGTLAMTVELTGSNGMGKEYQNVAELDALWDGNRAAFLGWAKAARTGVAVSVVSAATGEPIPCATFQIASTMPIYADVGGYLYKNLSPGLWPNATITAEGYLPQTLTIGSLPTGTTRQYEVALTPEAGELLACLPEERHLPGLPHEVSLRTHPPMAKRAAVLTCTVPTGWSVSQDGWADASRHEADGSRSWLYLADDGDLANLPPLRVVPDATPLADHVLHFTLAWDGGEFRSTRAWTIAEPRVISVAAGLSGTPAMVASSEKTVQMWSGTGYVTKTGPLLAGIAFWIEPPSTLQAWTPARLRWSLAPGWNLLYTPWPRDTASIPYPIFLFQNGLLTRPTRLPAASSFWIFAQKQAILEAE